MSICEIYKVFRCERVEIQKFIETHHYSKSINGVDTQYCFKLVDNDNNLIGAMVYGKLGMANVWKKYAAQYNDLLELRRLCCIDDTPKNTESFFIGQTLRWLYKNTNVKKIISYADETHGHLGIIYKATNFTYVGTTKPSRMILFNGKLYHDKTIRTYHNGKLKPYASTIKNALNDGTASYINTKQKHIYIYTLRTKDNKTLNKYF